MQTAAASSKSSELFYCPHCNRDGVPIPHDCAPRWLGPDELQPGALPPAAAVEVSDFEVAHELAQLLATSRPSSLDRERAERLDWILRAYREAGAVGVVAFVRGELIERQQSAPELPVEHR